MFFLELYRGKQRSHIFFTHSYWAIEKHLNTYKNSMVFRDVWSKIKVLFNKKLMQKC